MRQNELNRQVARATGESVSTIRRLGFLLAEPSEAIGDPDSESLGGERHRLGCARRLSPHASGTGSLRCRHVKRMCSITLFNPQQHLIVTSGFGDSGRAIAGLSGSAPGRPTKQRRRIRISLPSIHP